VIVGGLLHVDAVSAEWCFPQQADNVASVQGASTSPEGYVQVVHQTITAAACGWLCSDTRGGGEMVYIREEFRALDGAGAGEWVDSCCESGLSSEFGFGGVWLARRHLAWAVCSGDQR
jgi:hypothetical protein